MMLTPRRVIDPRAYTSSGRNLLHFGQVTRQYVRMLLPSSKQCRRRGSVVIRLIIAVVVGLLLAVGGTFLVNSVLTSQANGTPSNTSLYNYGSR